MIPMPKSNITMHSFTSTESDHTLGGASVGDRLILCVPEGDIERTLESLLHFWKLSDSPIRCFKQIEISYVNDVKDPIVSC